MIAPNNVIVGVSGLAEPVRIADTEPAAAAIAAETPNTSVFVRARLTPITAAAVSLSRIAISERPVRLLTMPRHTRYDTTSTITASQYKNTSCCWPTSRPRIGHVGSAAWSRCRRRCRARRR